MGGGDRRQPIDRFHRKDWDRLLKVDLTGPHVVPKALIPLMEKDAEVPAAGADLEQRMGALEGASIKRIINISSVAGVVPLRRACSPRMWLPRPG